MKGFTPRPSRPWRGLTVQLEAPMPSEQGWEMLSSPWITVLVGVAITFWTGALNGVTTLTILFGRAVHVTGTITDIGIHALLLPINALLLTIMWISYVLGGILGGKLLDRIGFTTSLLLIAGMIAIGALLVWGGFYAESPEDYGFGRMVIAFVLPFAMGFQNAVTSSTPIGRTTHFTGPSTDMSLALAKGNYHLASRLFLKILGFTLGGFRCLRGSNCQSGIPIRASFDCCRDHLGGRYLLPGEPDSPEVINACSSQ